MTIELKKYSFENFYLPIGEYIIADEEKDVLSRRSDEEIPFPVTDGNILDAVIRIIITRPDFKTPLAIARRLKLDKRELGGALHILTDQCFDDLLYQYRLRAMKEVLENTKISTKVIAKYYGYASLQSMNQFLSDHTGLTANEIRKGKVVTEKVKKLPWWKL